MECPARPRYHARLVTLHRAARALWLGSIRTLGRLRRPGEQRVLGSMNLAVLAGTPKKEWRPPARLTRAVRGVPLCAVAGFHKCAARNWHRARAVPDASQN